MYTVFLVAQMVHQNHKACQVHGEQVTVIKKEKDQKVLLASIVTETMFDPWLVRSSF